MEDFLRVLNASTLSAEEPELFNVLVKSAKEADETFIIDVLTSKIKNTSCGQERVAYDFYMAMLPSRVEERDVMFL